MKSAFRPLSTAITAFRRYASTTTATATATAGIHTGAPTLGSTNTKVIEISDVTLRDGMQGKGMSLTLPDKIKVAMKLDSLGFDFIEGGFPQSNPKDQEFFLQLPTLGLTHSKICAFGMTRRKGITAEQDEGLEMLLRSKAPIVVVVGKTWDLHVTHILGCSQLKEHLDMIQSSIAFLKTRVSDVFYDAEHFFDGYKANPTYALDSLRAAIEGGATRVVLCDTNGGSMPTDVSLAVRAVKAALLSEGYGHVRLGIHVHNDGGLAVANTLAAVEAGCVHVQGTVNGCGERCGNVDLMTVIPNLTLKLGYTCLRPDSIKEFMSLSSMLYELTGTSPIVNQPYVGKGAFAHKGGMHAHAVQQVAHSYEHINPTLVGNTRSILVSEMAGQSSLKGLLDRKFKNFDANMRKQLVQRVAQLENQGYEFESAEASLELLAAEFVYNQKNKKSSNIRSLFWTLNHYTVRVIRNGKVESLDETLADNLTGMISDAIVKIRVGSVDEMCIAEGDGPVHAVDAAMRKALSHHYPSIQNIRLTDYRVRVVNPGMGTGAKVRILGDFVITHPGGSNTMITIVGVHSNIITASVRVIEDALIYHLLQTSGTMQFEETDTTNDGASNQGGKQQVKQ